MGLHNREHRDGFGEGLTWICGIDDQEYVTGIGVGVLKLKAGELYKTVFEQEMAWLLMTGKVEVDVNAENASLSRDSIFDEAPSCIHGACGAELTISCIQDCEFTLYQTANTKLFSSRIYLPENVSAENRGKGQIGDTCWRVVRTIFGVEDGNEASDLVLGEVITLPGRWSSYPPHHHSQPEIYHYRFTEPQGFGHAELGDDVLKVKQNDTVKILDLNDHAQCSAPGYGMYYSWVIRHLENDRYDVPEFTEEHRWVMEPGAKYWQIKS
ncbi:5-deoxy-glucuronate isomerase [Oceanicoccus sp. KOV_DT_Chl]|uniref:5-deoxy-glucuronate isomerase n=1 Tax=Oceanicoccus sp. KOV_DT_Chl TaxID=1904639 RepID=UPI000C7E580A|nr:5-deoxy-glucuronate isomerase [Oceanicoccus sp. KOV_DT_Chl]